jgi:DNA replication protein DnaC
MKLLELLKLKGIQNLLDELVSDAEQQKCSYISFLNQLFTAEVEYRTGRRLQRNMSAAHFPIEKRIESFVFGQVQGIGKSDIVNLLDCRWIDNRENLLFFGPPGIGKTHLSIALGVNAIEKGYTVCFERISNLMRLLLSSPIQKVSEYRIRKIMKSNVLIIDEIGYTPIDRKEANLFFNLISELYENASIVITSNKSFDCWAEMMGDDIMTTALLDRLLHHGTIYNLDGQSYRLKDKLEKEEE